MTRNFVLAFGGTGARCAEAFTYLMASRAVTEPCHVLIIDPDQANGSVETARTQLTRYRSVHAQLVSRGDVDDRPFFAAPLNEGKSSFFWANPSAGSTWSSALGYATKSESTRELLDLLYDGDDLNLTFDRGYIGRAHIGSLDLLRTLKRGMLTAKETKEDVGEPDALHHFYRELRAATQGGQRANLIILGSIFGGTGASGLPAVPPLVRETMTEELRKRIQIACVQVAPYFTFPEGRAGDPDSAIHPLATQTALRHYASTNVGYDRIYLVGAPERPTTAGHNNPGGSNQHNDAHYAELGAALAAAHFFAQPPDGEAGRGATELLTSSAQTLAWGKLPFHRETTLRRNLVAFATFAAVYSSYFGPDLSAQRHIGSVFNRTLERGNRRLGGQEPVLEDLRMFCERFLGWIRDLQRNTGNRFFTLDETISDESPGKVSDGGKLPKNPVPMMMAQLQKEQENHQETGPGFYVHALTRTVDRFCDDNYVSWSKGA